MNKLVLDLSGDEVELLERFRDKLKDGGQDLDDDAREIAIIVVTRLGSLNQS